ncbi:hypothetical protein [Roseinatronobacter sp. NSM]|uniref:hypothetical protein n=1 Tax=Roseinatronobacter sp. NSM TaxID=3457785 RepID=UPI0040372308
MKTPLMLMIGVTTLGLAALAADARGTERPALPGFEQLDQNQSGTITLEDFQTHLGTQRSGQSDQIVEKLMEQANADGLLDESALRAGLEALAQGRRAAMTGQRRGPGAGDRADVAQRMFGRIDANDDGVVDAQEYEAFTDRMQTRMTRQAGRNQGSHRGYGPKNRAHN